MVSLKPLTISDSPGKLVGQPVISIASQLNRELQPCSHGWVGEEGAAPAEKDAPEVPSKHYTGCIFKHYTGCIFRHYTGCIFRHYTGCIFMLPQLW